MRMLMIAGLAILATPALAQRQGIYVEYYDIVNGWTPHPNYPADFRLSQPGLASGSNVSIPNANNLAYRVFTASPSTEDIGTVSMSVAVSGARLFIGYFNSFLTPVEGIRLDRVGCRNLRGVFTSGPQARTAQVQGRIPGNLGVAGVQSQEGIDVYTLVRFDVDGSILGPVSHRPDPAAPTNLGTIIVGGNVDTSGSGRIVAFGGSINRVQVGGELRAGVWATTGSIGDIVVTGDVVGAGGSLVPIDAKADVRSVTARSLQIDLNADEDADGIGTLSLIRTTGVAGHLDGVVSAAAVQALPGETSVFDLSGNLVGSVEIDGDLDERFVIDGDVSGQITILGDITSAGRIDIGGQIVDDGVGTPAGIYVGGVLEPTYEAGTPGNLSDDTGVIAFSGGLPFSGPGQIVFNCNNDPNLYTTSGNLA